MNKLVLIMVALAWNLLVSQGTQAGSFVTNAALLVARAQPTATLLPDGKVLVAGGNNPSGELSSAELYDPATKTWTLTGAMPGRRNSSLAVLLPDGRVLVAAGYDDDGFSDTAALYNPSTGKWTATGRMTTPHYLHTMTLLTNGKVLVAGGENGEGGTAKTSPSTRKAELFDPATGKWTATGSMTARRSGHTATLLASGQVLVSSGYTDGGMDGQLLASTELYDPGTGEWTRTGPLNIARFSHAATLLPDRKVLIAGGFGETNSAATSVELFDPATGNWTVTGSMNNGHSSPTATLLSDGRVLVVGGVSAELYEPTTGAWTTAFSLNPALAYHTVTSLHDGRVLVAGGFYNGVHLSTTGLFNPATAK